MLTKDEIKQKTAEIIMKYQIGTVYIGNYYIKHSLTDYGKGFLEAIRMVLDTDEEDCFVSYLDKILGA